MKEDVLKGYKAGADDYLNKPLIQKYYWWRSYHSKKSSDTKTEQVQHEFNIGKFHLNSKLRFWLLMMKNLLNYLQKKMSYLKC
jgi:DNA-binding response OmpR family regulator